jgi:hypothetical protein
MWCAHGSCCSYHLNHVMHVQEEYKNEDDIGSLDCGHDYHTDCIKQWLMHKNLCPICKTTGLATWDLCLKYSILSYYRDKIKHRGQENWHN